ncbi:hypothetical protein [Listeria portnoyi]|uniref:hypothetical protein n=1 Tax=Listeria portnoyi TaxID=2713504 RepID=UPI00164DA9A7|nr:hypothetical protein [Listeria portnoyi]
MKPKYAENIIVGVVYKKIFKWYITDRDTWILDIDKYSEAYLKNGYDFDMNFALGFRNKIHVIDETTIEEYAFAYEKNQVDSDELQNLLVNKQYEDTVLALQASLYIDFDKKIFVSSYPESLPFESYTPTGWKSSYGDFTEYIPKKERYWILGDKNLISEEYKLEVDKFKEGK